MNNLTNQQRKLVYFGGILFLLIPIILLGMPGTPNEDGTISGGFLAEIRHKEKLGEATMGKVDPSSSAMNLVLLGFRGVAASVQNVKAMDYFDTKNWGKFLNTVDSVISLQPHYYKVWSFQGWNISYNVSSQWDGVEDRYWWVKEGAGFLKRGSALNEEISELDWFSGEILGKKIGRSDEAKHFRMYFNPEGYPNVAADKKGDPDRARWKGGPDRNLNPYGEDNYLVARRAYQSANKKETESEFGQRVMTRIMFRSMAAHSLIGMANAMQSEGVFNEAIARRWEIAHDAWIHEFGREDFYTYGGRLQLDMTDEELKSVAEEENVTLEEKVRQMQSTQNMVNYRYWKTYSLVESLPETTAVHQDIYNGQELTRSGLISPDGHWRVTDLGHILLQNRETGDTAPFVPATFGLPLEVKAAQLTDEGSEVLKHLRSSGAQHIDEIAKALGVETGPLKQRLTKLGEIGLVKEVCKAEALIESGLVKYEKVLDTHADIRDSDEAVELVLMAYLNWNVIVDLNRPRTDEGTEKQKSYPQVRPFAKLWRDHQAQVPMVQARFDRANSGR
ncbi:MAG: hypothetical protein O3A00_10815 [Planctomycetota bacterium]|nr:hypothetical protein [Planctomycetota bacterium]